MLQRLIAAQLARPSGWIGRWLTAGWLNRANRGMNRLTLDTLALRPGDRVLEVGFGGGALLEEIAADARVAHLAGVDLSPEMVAALARRLPGAELRQGDVAALPFPDAHFTALCTVNTLYFWPDPGAAFAECGRVLAPGGRLVVCFNDAADLRAWPGHVHGFRLHEAAAVEALLRQAGFAEVYASSTRDPAQGLVHALLALRR